MNSDIEKLLNLPLEKYKALLTNKFGILDMTKPITLFGAGQMGEIHYTNCIKHNISISGIFDNDKHQKGKVFGKNLKVMSVQDLSSLSKNTQVIVTSIFDEDIIKQLNKLGFLKVWSHAYASTIFPDVFHNSYWLNNIEKIIKNKKKVIESYSLLKDTLSRKTFYAIMKYRLFLEKKDLNKLIQPISDEYFDRKIMNISNDEVFIDGGAYNGDTTKKFIRFTNRKYKNIIDFEPDTNLFQQLSQYVTKLNDKRIAAYPFGLGKKNLSVHFTNDGTLGSRISKAGTSLIKIVNLDKVLKINPTFIKFDIEGAEQDAIIGSRKIISTLRPKIALSIYHKTEDLWEIPLLLKKMRPDYCCYIRHYSPFLYDTIYYAI